VAYKARGAIEAHKEQSEARTKVRPRSQQEEEEAIYKINKD